MTPFFLLLTLGATGESLTPGPADLEAALVELGDRLHRARALETATARVQNALAQGLAAGGAVCSLADLGLRSQVFGAAHRDAAQAALTQAGRVDRMLASPTLKPLLEAGHAPEARVDSDEAVRQDRMQREFAAWHQKHVRGLSRCNATLVAMEGLPPQSDDDAVAVPAVLVLEGVLCPGALPPGIHVQGMGCWAAEACGCDPVELLPAQVLGPRPEGPAPVEG